MAQKILGTGAQSFPKDTTIGNAKLGSLQGLVGASVNTTLTASDNGAGVFVSPAVTVTLPPLDSVPTGAVYHFRTSSTGANRIIKGDGAENISLGTGLGNAATLRDGETLSLVCAGSSWVNVGGTAGLENTAGFGYNLSANGYQKLPSSLIIQWGSIPAIASGGNAIITYPIVFPNGNLSIAVTAGSQGCLNAVLGSGGGNAKANFQVFNTISGSPTSGAGTYIAIGY